MLTEDIIIRAISEKDLDSVLNLTTKVESPFSSLPVNNRVFWEKRIKVSVDSFKNKLEKQDSIYLLVMENLSKKEIIGICGITGSVGSEPFYNYKISKIRQKNNCFNKIIDHEILTLVNDLQDSSDFISLFLSPAYRGNGAGQLLSKSRFLFLASFRELFCNKIIAEIRGAVNKDSSSYFWDAVGDKFFDMNFPYADLQTILKGKQYIADLMPTYPIYVDLLPKRAQEVIGVPANDAKPAKLFLEREGFKYKGYVDIFDAGPVIEAELKNIETVKQSREIIIEDIQENIDTDKYFMLCNKNMDFKLLKTKIKYIDDSRVVISNIAAKNLNLQKGYVAVCAPFDTESRVTFKRDMDNTATETEIIAPVSK